MSSKVLHCITFFEVRNLVLCLTHELLKFLNNKIMLKLLCKNKFNSAFINKNVMEIEEELTWEYILFNVWFCMKYIAKYFNDTILYAHYCRYFFSVFLYFILKFK